MVVGQRLQVAADARLGHLEHDAQLGDGQLVLLEQQQHPAPERVCQRGHVLEDGDHVSVNPDVMLHVVMRAVNR